MRRYLWALDLLVLGAVALAAAHATCLAAGAALLRLSTEEPSPARPVAAASARIQSARREEEITTRNIFCSACRGPGTGRTSGASSQRETPPALRLLAVMYAAPPADRRRSLAVIKDARGATGAYAVGGSVCAAIIEAIEAQRVSLRLADGRRQTLALLDGQPAREDPPPAPSDPLAAELEAGVTRIDENRYDVRRATIESLLGKIDGLPPQARLEPQIEIRDGKTIGFRLRDLKEGGVFSKLGLRDGDVIASVNGLATNGPDNALAIYASLRSAGHLSVELDRAGRHVTSEYDIR